VTEIAVTIVCAGATTVMVALIIAFSHSRLTATVQAGWNGKTASVVIANEGPAQVATRGAGGFGPLVWMPAWRQTGGLLPDGNLDPQQYNDCGETCCAMVIAAVRGIRVAPGELRQELGGVQRSGLTSPGDLVQVLAANHIQAHVESMDAANAWMLLAACYGTAKPVVVLGYWLNMACMHWMLLVDKAPARFVFLDPWTASRREVTLAEWRGHYTQAVVVVDDHCYYDMSASPTPGTGREG